MSAQAPTSSSGLACLVVDDLEGVLDPDVVAVAVAEAVGDRSSPALDQGRQLLEDAWRVVGVQALGPALRVGGHLLGRVAHDRAEVLADEGAGVAAGGRVV